MSEAATFNQRMYSGTIKLWIPSIDEHDLKFLCNKSAKVYRQVESAGCVDNFRVSIAIEGKASSEYMLAKENGCCGSTDRKFTNPKTGNCFIIGFNFGH